ncbi:unnamed protein product [Adineta steineri]|uniref:Uncharacterized protein n=1 Tax=Adineta steineri TaxID=433720 RepID=A0A813N649_9BILA|nr:unnamed protein product [Adineta steineri]CAF1093120.1 unnamed protein product [Adineta steineri]
MASGGGDGRSSRYGSSSSMYRGDDDNDYSSRGSNNSFYGSQNSLNHDMTHDVVADFKKFVQNKIDQRQPISQPIMELEIAKIRRKRNPNRYELEQWKQQLPYEIKNCSDSILRVSMAYGDNPNQIKSVIQSKMNEINSNVDPMETSLENIAEPLRKLRSELERTPLTNVFRAVHNINRHGNNRAERLFLSEAYHFAPGLNRYTYDDAHNAVEAISRKKFESDKSDHLLSIIKTCKDVDDIYQYIEKISPPPPAPAPPSARPQPTTTPPPQRPTNVVGPQNTTPSPSNTNPHRNFYFKPLENPYKTSPQTSDRSSRQFGSTSRDERSESPLERDLD